MHNRGLAIALSMIVACAAHAQDRSGTVSFSRDLQVDLIEARLFKNIALDTIVRARVEELIRKVVAQNDSLDHFAADAREKVADLRRRMAKGLRALLKSDAEKALFDANVKSAGNGDSFTWEQGVRVFRRPRDLGQMFHQW
jgi:hypothetical protein